MKKEMYIVTLLFVFNQWAGQTSIRPFDHILTFFIMPYPTQLIEKNKEGKPSTVSHQPLRKTNDGIFVSFMGYLAASNYLGQVTLPFILQQPSQACSSCYEFSLLITEKIVPIFMVGNTIHHWEIIPTTKNAFYSLERKQDPETQLYYWEIQEKPLPANNMIPLNTITIFAQPENIYVPKGITLTNSNPQLFLPPLYAKQELNRVEPSLITLKTRQFFDPVKSVTKKNNEPGKPETAYATGFI